MAPRRLLKDWLKPLKAFRKQPEKEAWCDEWRCCKAGNPRHKYPTNYPTYEEKLAFRHGWDCKADVLAGGVHIG
jgi:hypothetical protein